MYRISCDDCGQALEVGAGNAGGVIVCPCGRRVRIPSLSRLRKSVGQPAYETGPIDVVRRLIAEGVLPGGENCAISGLPTSDVLTVKLELERLTQREPPRGVLFLLAMLLSPWILAAVHQDGRPPVGHETKLRVPLRVRREHHRDLARRSARRRLMRLLWAEPAYAELLRRYPKTTCRVIEEDGR